VASLQARNAELKARRAELRDKRALEREARRLGMVKAGEKAFVVQLPRR
jgi:cell division protein FtsB